MVCFRLKVIQNNYKDGGRKFVPRLTERNTNQSRDHFKTYFCDGKDDNFPLTHHCNTVMSPVNAIQVLFLVMKPIAEPYQLTWTNLKGTLPIETLALNST